MVSHLISHFTPSSPDIHSSPFFPLVAMIRDENKLVVVQKQSTKPIITLYTSSGRQMGTIQWDKGRIVGMGWTDAEQLICVLDDGTVRIYSIHGEFTQFSLGKVFSPPFNFTRLFGAQTQVPPFLSRKKTLGGQGARC